MPRKREEVLLLLKDMRGWGGGGECVEEGLEVTIPQPVNRIN